MSFAYKIGVLKADKNYKCNEEITIDLDVEDNDNATKVLSGEPQASLPGISLGGHVIFTYCAISDNEMQRVPYDFLVLQLDSRCPTGTYSFVRQHDTENSNNKNSVSGSINPSVVNKKYAKLQYCFVPANNDSKQKYPVDKQYGVFANPDLKSSTLKNVSSYIKHSEIYIDDEDDHNRTISVKKEKCKDTYSLSSYNNWKKGHCFAEANASFYAPTPLCNQTTSPFKICEEITEHEDVNYNDWTFYESTKKHQNRIQEIVHGTDNTQYHVIRWTSSNKNMLLKHAVTASNSNPISNSLVDAVPSVPQIKNINRSTIEIELQSVGKAKVSIVNVKGVKIAYLVEKNLQPGIHQFKWNSKIVPNGLYIVKIEQNGMVNTKNVFLK